VIRGIIEQTGVKIDVEDDGTIHVASADEASANKAIQIIKRSHGFGGDRQDVSGQGGSAGGFRRVRRDLPGTDGLLHISEIAETRIQDVRDELRKAIRFWSRVLALEGNKIKLSRKAVLKEQREKLKRPRSSSNAASACLHSLSSTMSPCSATSGSRCTM